MRRILLIMLIAAPLAVVARLLNANPVLVFALSAIGLIPLADYIGEGTEELAHYTGPRLGGLLNATLGNAAELIITIFAINAGLLELVKASITGSILGNLLLVLGLSLLAGGLKNGIQTFDRRQAGLNATLLVLAVVVLLIPSFFDRGFTQGVTEAPHEEAVEVGTPVEGESGESEAAPTEPEGETAVAVADLPQRELLFNEGVAVIILILYALTVWYGFTVKSPHEEAGHHAPVPADAPATEANAPHAGVVVRDPAPIHNARWSLRTAALVLVGATVGVAVLSETLVGAVEPVVEALGLTEFFLGIIIIPLVGNVAEHLVAVEVAYKNKMELSLAVSLGSSLQIALFVAPVLVFISLLFGQRLLLVFNDFELIALASASLIASLIALDGESNWLEGAMLLAVYLIIGLAFFFLPVMPVHP
jgi:Ca2+:H+ antiporter